MDNACLGKAALEASMVSRKFADVRPQIPAAAGRHSTPQAAKSAAFFAQDDSPIVERTSDSGH
jgi:hypothetical protein